MNQNSSGIVLRARPFTETSLIVHLLTADLGLVSAIAKGARRPKSAFRGKLDLFYEVAFQLRFSKRSHLHTLFEVTLVNCHPRLRENLGYINQLSYFAQLIETVVESDAPVPDLYSLMRNWLENLALEPPRAVSVFAFEFRLLEVVGLQPELKHSPLSAGSRQLAGLLGSAEWEMLHRLKFSAAQASEIGAFLHQFLAYNLGKVPQSRAVALSAGQS
jgi:DNA repair protein RecO